MPEKESAFEFDPLTGYSLKQRILIRLADIFFYVFVATVGASLRFETRAAEHWQAAEKNGQPPIHAFWHENIIHGTTFFRDRGIVVMTSKSFDGEYIARFIKRLGFGAVRGSSSRGGAEALIAMIRLMRAGHPAAFALDGPRGPRHEAKPGPILLAKKTGSPILPFVLEPRRYWTLRSWDKLQIPRPFSRTLVLFAPPIYVERDAGDAEMLQGLAELQQAMEGLNRQAGLWSGRLAADDQTAETSSSVPATGATETNDAPKST